MTGSESLLAGRWCAFVAGPSNGWDRTILGIAVYAKDGSLAWWRWCGIEKAEQRGDWHPDWLRIEPNPPASWDEMEKRLGSTGNAMSAVRWEGGLATLAWDDQTWDREYRHLVLGERGAA